VVKNLSRAYQTLRKIDRCGFVSYTRMIHFCAAIEAGVWRGGQWLGSGAWLRGFVSVDG
jgi:hypothetical protein